MELFRRSSNQPIHPADWSQAPRSTKLLALAVIVLVAAGILAVQQAGRAYETQGPSRIARNPAGSTLIDAYEKLFLVDAQQHLTQLTAADLGLGGPINSITTQGDDWILGDDSDGLLYRCDAALRACRPLFPTRKERLFSRAHGLTQFDGKWIVSDSERHRLRVYDSSGNELLSTRTQPIELCYPNEVIAVDGRLYVTDTNNFRIAQVDPDTWTSSTFIQTAAGAPLARANCADLSSHVAERGDAYGNLMLDTVNTVGRPTLTVARHNRILPASLLYVRNGDWWVVQMKGMMTYGDVILYSPEGVARLRVNLPEDSEPTNLLETANGVLVTDPTLARIYDVGLDGQVREDWGPAELKTQWQQILLTRARWQRLQPFGWLLLAVAIACGLIVIVREVLRTKGNWNPEAVRLTPGAAKPQALNAAEVWLATEPKFQKRSRITAWVLIVALLAMMVFAGPAVYRLVTQIGQMSVDAARFTWFVFVLLALPVLLMVYAIRSLFMQARSRLGTNGYQLLFDPGNSTVLACDFEQVMASQHLLLTDNRFINVFAKRGKPIYAQDQLQALILARIPPANFVSPLRLFYTSLKRGNVSAWATVIATSVVVIIQFGRAFAPQWNQHFSQLLQHWLKH